MLDQGAPISDQVCVLYVIEAKIYRSNGPWRLLNSAHLCGVFLHGEEAEDAWQRLHDERDKKIKTQTGYRGPYRYLDEELPHDYRMLELEVPCRILKQTPED